MFFWLQNMTNPWRDDDQSKASVLKTPFVETYQVDGWNPKQPPGMVLKTRRKEWDIYKASTG